jgi:hypothetical protein
LAVGFWQMAVSTWESGLEIPPTEELNVLGASIFKNRFVYAAGQKNATILFAANYT